MIISSSKPFSEILDMLADKESVFIVGCSVCAAKQHVGGEPEVEEMRSNLKDAGINVIGGVVAKAACSVRSCEALEELAPEIKDADAVLVMACGSGTSNIARFVDVDVYPANNTQSLGAMAGDKVIHHLCAMCGQCTIAEFGGVCPTAQCPKELLNGPCGGSMDGKCEVDPEKDCAWELIYERLERIGRLDLLDEVRDAKDRLVK
ncbi:methylenetetrahydrofolate reductase C-terminal domain-containing protein [Methanococcoides methylutens]|uniref:Zinc-finger protein n=1 Tax=Methanococcoides methylutens MM1 TaxID=1434104 RepID=A0A0E3X081_METMT|nr:methylenetetrahydrofolate reductase C-terminal domain-containing protein [Methanococcoides methylutens]AKB84120.1 Zinc-finger protein [Methanococcoides methylutens MM1]